MKKSKTSLKWIVVAMGLCLTLGLFSGCNAEKQESLTGTVGAADKVELLNMYEDQYQNFYIVTTRGTNTTADMTTDFVVPNSETSALYPGAVVQVDPSSILASQKVLAGEDIPRNSLDINVEVKGGASSSLQVDPADQETVNRYIQKEVKNQQGTAETTVKHAMASSKEQIAAELGIQSTKENSDYGVDYKAILYGKHQVMFIVFDQVYYSATTAPKTTADLFQQGVTAEQLAANGIDENAMNTAEVTGIDYGRRVIVKLTTSDMSNNVQADWEAAITKDGLKKSGGIEKHHTDMIAFVAGGANGNEEKVARISNEVDDINAVISGETEFNKDLTAIPLAYRLNYIHDGSPVEVVKNAESANLNRETREKIRIQTDPAHAYTTQSEKIYGRPIVGVNSDGSYQLGKWVLLSKDENVIAGEYKDMSISGKYAELAFSFDILSGTKWPYSDVFWTADKGPAKDVYIEWGGTIRNSWIEITVNGKRVVDEKNCSSHEEKKF